MSGCSYCGGPMTTGGWSHLPGCPMLGAQRTNTVPFVAPPPIGWRCPVCQRVNAPSVASCPCSPSRATPGGPET